ncbi:MAG: helix-turn-helix domain-containing protein [Alicyclobacillus sp.]|nr:helix-turn-helix domain-containing protein [Alicyclobacillus sp.]
MQQQSDSCLGVNVEDIPLVFDCKFLAKILGVSVSTARTIMHQPGFPVMKFSARKHRIYRAKFLEWLERQSQGGTSGVSDTAIIRFESQRNAVRLQG